MEEDPQQVEYAVTEMDGDLELRPIQLQVIICSTAILQHFELADALAAAALLSTRIVLLAVMVLFG